MKKVKAIAFIFLCGLMISACASRDLSSQPDHPPSAPTETSRVESYIDPSVPHQPYNEQITSVKKPDIRRVTLSAVGDIMMHMPQTRAGIKPDGTRNYDFFFDHVKPYIETSDLAIANLELTLSKNGPYSGFPRFKAPVEIVDALQAAGFDVLVTANNHSLDNNEKGIITTLDHIEQRGLIPIGTNRTLEEDKPHILEKNGLRIGLAAYTYGTNGIPIPDGKPYLVNLIDPVQMREDMAYLDSEVVDFKVVALHFGQEYHRAPSEQQRNTVMYLNSLGVDVVIGSHPHVLQPIEWIEGEDRHKTLVIYSLGNFISNQKDPFTDSGFIFQCTLTKNLDTNETSVQKLGGIPTAVLRPWNNGRRSYQVIAVSDLMINVELIRSVGKKEAYYQTMWNQFMQMYGEEIVRNDL
jgi:poly-gamma-glutamate capsule biosynthesis protein CapA/YwtB (metallophosphatase superfamily)